MRHIYRIFAAVLVLLCAACANLSGEPPIVATILPATAPPPTEPPPDDRGFPASAPDIASGAAIYAANCAACHGETGRGDGPVALANPDMQPGDFTNPTSARRQDPRDWFRTITDGRIENLMPPWGNALTEQERWDVALYTYTMHYTPDMLALGERIFQECAECHGLEGRGDGPDAADVGADVRDLSDPRAMMTISDEAFFHMITQGSGYLMPAYDMLSEEERRAVAAYARTLSLDRSGVTVQPTAGPVETTDALTTITGTALLVQIHAVGDALEVVQALRVSNTSDTLTFNQNLAMPDGTTAALALTIPDGALLSSSTGVGGISADGRTAYIFDPILPRTEQLYLLSYTLPYTVGDPVSIPLDIVVAGPVRVLIRPLEVRLTGDRLAPMGEQALGEDLYNAYGGQLVFESGSTLTFTLSGTPEDAPAVQPTAAPTVPRAEGVITSDILAPLIIAAVLLLAAAVAVYAYRTRTVSPEARIMQIAREIGIIDAAHNAGTLNHDLWHRQRAALKAEQMRLRGFPEDKPE